MAKVTYVPGSPTLSGRLGNVVYRRRNGQAEIVRPPRKPRAGWSAAQDANRDRFRIAAAYARDVLADSLQAEYYARLAAAMKRSGMSILIGDYLSPPTVDAISDSAYRGQRGDVIRILATDDVAVIAVHVTLRDRHGAELEQGPATEEHGVWNYAAQTTLPPGEPVTIEVIALDRPRHEGKGSKAWMPSP
jgi:hypothetical protein